MNSKDILSPDKWLESQVDSIGGKTLAEIMQAYAAHVAARVHRNTRHRAVEILNEEVADYVENEDQMGSIIGDNAGRRIMQIPLREVYPAQEGLANGA